MYKFWLMQDQYRDIVLREFRDSVCATVLADVVPPAH